MIQLLARDKPTPAAQPSLIDAFSLSSSKDGRMALELPRAKPPTYAGVNGWRFSAKDVPTNAA